MEKETSALRKSLTAQKEKVRGREKSKMRLGLSPEGCTKQDNEVFLKKSDKITFLKINFLPFKPKENTRFLKNYGIAVKKKRKKSLKKEKNA